MEFHAALASLEKNEVFTAWRAKHPKHYLVHGFLMLDPKVKSEWQIGYYGKDDRIVTFVISDEGSVTVNPPSEIFKKEKKVVELSAALVEIDLAEALEIATHYQQTHYKGHEPGQTMALLQHLERGQVWNITFITKTFAVCNIKIDAATAEVLHASCETLLAWGDAIPGERRKS